MSTSNRLWCVFAVMVLIFAFALPTIGSRVGIMVEEGDADPSDYAWKLIFPNGSLSVTSNVATVDLSGSYATLASPTFTGTVTLADAIVAFDKKLYFGDTGIYIWADDDGILDIVSDTTIESSAAWVHTGNFWATTYGSDSSVTDAELKYINTLSSNAQTQITARASGAASSTDHAIARYDSTTGKILLNSLGILNDAGAMTGLTSMTVDASATPGVTGYDSDVAGDDVWKIYGSATDANDSVFYVQVEQANGLVTYITLDGVGETVDLAKPLDMGANAITSTGTIDTTGLTTGGVKTVVDANPADGEIDAYCYGGVFYASGTGTAVLPAVAVGMQVTVENHTADDVWIDPDASEVIRLNGVALTGGFRILGTDLGDGCVLTYYSAGVWSAFCSGYADAGS